MRSVPEYGPGALVLYTALALVTLCVAAHWRRAGRRAREMAARDQAHADALTCDAIHEAGRVAGHRAGYDVGHSRGYGEGYPTGWQLGCTAGEARMRRANARAQLGLPAQPWTFDPRTRLGRQLNEPGEGWEG